MAGVCNGHGTGTGMPERLPCFLAFLLFFLEFLLHCEDESCASVRCIGSGTGTARVRVYEFHIHRGRGRELHVRTHTHTHGVPLVVLRGRTGGGS